jgi:hypothetical protein
MELLRQYLLNLIGDYNRKKTILLFFFFCFVVVVQNARNCVFFGCSCSFSLNSSFFFTCEKLLRGGSEHRRADVSASNQ